MKLADIVLIQGKIRLLTGLHIGGGRDTLEIGGIDNPVILHPHTQEPCIPGSSLKGKVRSLLEYYHGKVGPGAGPCDCAQPGCPVCRIFGPGAAGKTEKEWKHGPTRAVFRDCQLDPAELEKLRTAGLPRLEEKTEVSIDRLQGKAASFGPRTMQRACAGCVFGFELVYRVFEDGPGGAKQDVDNLAELYRGFKLLTLDALGGSGSRGYGRVEIFDLSQTSVRGVCETKPVDLAPITL